MRNICKYYRIDTFVNDLNLHEFSEKRRRKFPRDLLNRKIRIHIQDDSASSSLPCFP